MNKITFASRHTPVMSEKVMKVLKPGLGKKYIDATFGEGGHSKLLLEAGAKVLALDWDKDNIRTTFNHPRLIKCNSNFADIETISRKNHFFPVDGILFDLGLTMMQIKSSGRGFSFQALNDPLDMRISCSNQLKTAAEIINQFNEKALRDILIKNSDEIYADKIVKAIVKARILKRIETVQDLVNVIYQLAINKTNRLALLRRVFQALRIAVNHEKDNLERGLYGALKIISNDGKIVVLTYHPTEDRWIKNIIRKLNLKFENKKAWQSKTKYRFERSVKLRVILPNPFNK